MTTTQDLKAVLPVAAKPKTAPKAPRKPAGPAMERLCLAANAYTDAMNALNGVVDPLSPAYAERVGAWERALRNLDLAGCARGAERERQRRGEAE